MRRQAQLFRIMRIAAAPLGLFFLGGLIRRVGRGWKRLAVERMPAHRPAPRSLDLSGGDRSWSPESSPHMQPGDERASVLGYQRSAPMPPDVAAEPGFTIGGDGAVIRKPEPGIH